MINRLNASIFILSVLLLVVACASRRFQRIDDTWKFWYHDKENDIIFYTDIKQPGMKWKTAYVNLRILNKNEYEIEVDYLLKIFSDKKKENYIETENLIEKIPKTIDDINGYADFEIEVKDVEWVSDIEFSRFIVTKR